MKKAAEDKQWNSGRAVHIHPKAADIWKLSGSAQMRATLRPQCEDEFFDIPDSAAARIADLKAWR